MKSRTARTARSIQFLGALAVVTAAGILGAAAFQGQASASSSVVSVGPVQPGATQVPIDIERSTLQWRGTKLRGRGSHSGEVRLAEGHLLQCGSVICGGRFVVDMTTIQVTDIPVTDPVPRQDLTDHLKSRDFFWSEQFPTAEFVLTKVQERGPGRYRVIGRLRIRDVTRTITFVASGRGAAPRAGVPLVIPSVIEASFRIDRQEWGITYRFDPIRDAIVDDEVEFRLSLRTGPGPAGVGIPQVPTRPPAAGAGRYRR